VVFDVWASWCGPCKAMIPHEREMAETLKGKPFSLISVSIDAEKADLEKFLKKTSMPWTHWWDANWDGKIAKALNIRSIPTIYVLDANGVIRYKNVRGEELTRAVETCLAEIKTAEKAK
jgi:thiol-disulfide isomerase/thioredoxin